MCRAEFMLVVVAYCVGVAYSWDLAITAGDQLLFYTNGIKTHNVSFDSQNLTALAYDEVHNMMLYVDKQNNNDTICGYDLSSENNICFIKRSGRNIQGLAFEPVSEIIFFTDTYERSINWISLKPGSKNDVYGNTLIRMYDELPTSISVDSCRGYVYWTNMNSKNPTIERARFDGSESEVVINTTATYSYATYTYEPHSLVVDQQTQKIYWIEGNKMYDSQYDLKSANLNGENKNYLLAFRQQLCPPSIMTVSKYSLYWVGCRQTNNSVNELPKYAASNGVHPEHIINFSKEKPAGIVANYKIEDQIQGVQQCEKMRNYLKNMAISNEFFKIPKNVDQTCIHGIKVNESSVCKCAPGYIGERCDISVCEHYCLQGHCSINNEQRPECWCNAGYSGRRCETNLCFNYCLNDGDCSLNEDGEPVCQCVGNHKGSRCEVDVNNTCTSNNSSTSYSTQKYLSLADLLSNWQKHTAKITFTVEV